MPDRGGNRGEGQSRRGPGGRKAPGGGPGRRAGPLSLRRVEGDCFELVHPRCVIERRDDFEEGLAIWRAGEPDEAREVLLFGLEGCGDNLWIHNALGRIALDVDRDPTLARGHFGYAVELVQRSLPSDFHGRLPAERPPNRPFFEAVAGLIACLEALDQPSEIAALRALADRLRGGA